MEFAKIYEEVTQHLIRENGLKRFVEDERELEEFLQKQKAILQMLFRDKIDWESIVDFYAKASIRFAVTLRLLKFFRQRYRAYDPPNLAEFDEKIDLLFEYVAKGNIKQSLKLLKESRNTTVLRGLLLSTVKNRWIDQIVKAVEEDDFSYFPLVSAQECDFTDYLFYPQSLLICSEAASCAHLEDLHTAMHKFAAEFYYLYTQQRYSQAYLIFRDLIDVYLQFSNLLAEFYFLTHSDLEQSFFTLLSYYNQSEHETYVILIDFHNLKRLNTLHGEEAVTQGMKRVEAMLRRMSEEEPEHYLFIKGSTANYYLLAIDKEQKEIEAFISDLRSISTTEMSVDGQHISFTTYIGALKLTNDCLLSRDDITKMLTELRKEAKEEKSGVVCAFSKTKRQRIYNWLMKRYQDTKYLEEKILNKEFEVVFQPINKASGNNYALESLIRIKEKDKLIPAFVFIDLLIELDLIVELDKITLELLEMKLPLIKKVTGNLFVNTSFDALCDPSYVTKLEHFIEKAKKENVTVVIELTEQQLVAHTDTIKRLKQKEFFFAVDDFGAGYTSIKTVADLAFESIIAYLKIDGSLIKEVDKNRELRQIVSVISEMAKIFNLFTVAEFVDNDESVEILRQKGIDLLQGYHIARPQPIEVLIAQKIKA